MSTGNSIPDAASAFSRIAADPAALRTFLACIGDADAPSRRRAAELLDGQRTIIDVGCGPGVFFDSLVNRRRQEGNAGEMTRALQYLGLDPVEELLHLAQGRTGLQIDVTRDLAALRCPLNACRFGEPMSAAGDPRGLLVLGDLAQLTAVDAGSVDAVVLRHLLEHLREPWPMLEQAARIVRRGGRLVVVLSQATRVAGMSQPLLTDTHLGAQRWSHYRPAMLRTLGPDWETLQHLTDADGLVVREELFCWVRR